MKKIYFTTLILLINLSLFAQLREFQKLFSTKINLSGEIQYFGDAWVNEQENTIDIFDLRNKKIYSVLLEKDIQSESTITTIEPKLVKFKL